jgi:GH24 family phage-related lysozyme (muramidase)
MVAEFVTRNIDPVVMLKRTWYGPIKGDWDNDIHNLISAQTTAELNQAAARAELAWNQALEVQVPQSTGDALLSLALNGGQGFANLWDAGAS